MITKFLNRRLIVHLDRASTQYLVENIFVNIPLRDLAVAKSRFSAFVDLYISVEEYSLPLKTSI